MSNNGNKKSKKRERYPCADEANPKEGVYYQILWQKHQNASNIESTNI
jgi:hypothetical protein